MINKIPKRELTEEQKKFLNKCGKLLKAVIPDKIPKGFVKASYYDEGNNIIKGLVLVLPKSIYDKRINLILSECMLKNGTYELYCKIREIDNGEMD